MLGRRQLLHSGATERSPKPLRPGLLKSRGAMILKRCLQHIQVSNIHSKLIALLNDRQGLAVIAMHFFIAPRLSGSKL